MLIPVRDRKEQYDPHDKEKHFHVFSTHEQCILFLISSLLLLSRIPGRIYGFLWAEDGCIFIEPAYRLGWHSIFLPYAEYLHFLPRLIAWIYSHLGDPKWIPRAFAWISLALSAYSVTHIGAMASRHLPRLGALAIALTPFAIMHNGEVWLNITNLQWVMAPLLAVLLWEMVEKMAPIPQATKHSYLETVNSLLKPIIAALLILTGPFGLIFGFFTLIAMIVKKIKAPCQWDRKFMTLFLCGFLAQGLTTFFCTLSSKTSMINANVNFEIKIWYYSFVNFIFTDVMGLHNITSVTSFEWIQVCSSVVIAAMFLIALFTERKWRHVILVLLTLAFLFWALSAIRIKDPTIITTIKGNRYSYLPIIFASWALIIGIVKARKRSIRSLALVMIGLVFLNSTLAWQNQKSPRIKIKELEKGKYSVKVPPSSDWNFTFTDPHKHSEESEI